MNLPATLQLEKIEARNCQTNGYEIRCRILGKGRPALLLHGWGASWHYWQWLMPALANSGYRVYAPDLPGHGDSAKPKLEYDSKTYYAFIRGLVEALGLERFTLAGHSLGGYIALALAEKNPLWVERLILVSPLYCPAQLLKSPVTRVRLPLLGTLALRLVPQWLVNFAMRFSSLAHSDNVPQSFLRQVAIDYKRATPHIANHRVGSPDLRPDLEQVNAPTLVAWGKKDMLLSSGFFEELVERLPSGQAYSFSNAGHSPLVEMPEEFNRVVLQFLKMERYEQNDGNAG